MFFFAVSTIIAVLIRMVMGRFLNIYPISLFTSIREEQGLNMEVVYPVYHSRCIISFAEMGISVRYGAAIKNMDSAVT
jgi:hypothetical protein